MVLPLDHLGKGGHPLELQNPACQREGVVQHCIDIVFALMVTLTNKEQGGPDTRSTGVLLTL